MIAAYLFIFFLDQENLDVIFMFDTPYIIKQSHIENIVLKGENASKEHFLPLSK